MSGILLGIVGVLYIFTGINYFLEGNIGLGIAFLSYSLANYGLYLAGTK